MTSLAAKVAQLPQLSADELAAMYEDLFGIEPPIRRHTWLWRRVAWRLQFDERGGLSREATERLLKLAEEYPAPSEDRRRTTTPAPGIRRARMITPGTIFEREYKGRMIRVSALADGFEWEGVTYSSLSAVAKAVTGSAWNGRMFFGLTKRKRGRADG